MLLESVYDVGRLIYNELNISIPRFQADAFFSLIITTDGKYCPGVGFDVDEILLQINSFTVLQDCYKKMIDNFCDKSSSWTGINAKYFDECDDSSAVQLTLFEKLLSDYLDDYVVWRTALPYSASYCYDIRLFTGANSFRGGHSSSDDNIFTYVHKRLFNYLKPASE